MLFFGVFVGIRPDRLHDSIHSATSAFPGTSLVLYHAFRRVHVHTLLIQSSPLYIHIIHAYIRASAQSRVYGPTRTHLCAVIRLFYHILASRPRYIISSVVSCDFLCSLRRIWFEDGLKRNDHWEAACTACYFNTCIGSRFSDPLLVLSIGYRAISSQPAEGFQTTETSPLRSLISRPPLIGHLRTFSSILRALSI